ncbi:RIM13 (YMR154C) [Zygosaccharomyces parabailii]|nr:RIM13 (YMR154C) [Zygosaccharomyces parabailii]
MDDWKLLNEVRRSLYLPEGGHNIKDVLGKLITVASKSDDIDFIKSVLIVKEDFDSLHPKHKLLWLTSRVQGDLYPPLSVDIAGPLPWNDVTQLANDKGQYCFELPLKCNAEISQISQCRDIENCSFVASLISMKAHGVEGPRIRKVGDSIYHVNLHFNGTGHRLVSVDTSSVPTDERGHQLSMCSSNLTDKIIEIAYLRVRATSYASRGSNAAVDTFMLTGYAPEVKSTTQPIMMENLIKLLQAGACLLAVGTGSHPSVLPLPLLHNHDYPIIGADLKRQKLTLQDPLDSDLRPEVTFKDVVRDYKQLYVNWHTKKLFACEKTFEFFYNLDKCNRFDTAMEKPLFILDNKSDSTQSVWLLLESHLIQEKSIAYLQELPTNIMTTLGAPHEGACDIGLQLLKLRLPRHESKTIFCHSSVSNAYTVHLYTNSSDVKMNRSTAEKFALVIECNADNLSDCYIGSPFYYKNPTFELSIDPCGDPRQVTVSLQLISQNPKDMVNLQLYNMDDDSLQRPILMDTHYAQQRHDRPFIPLFSKVSYKLICSTYSEQPDHYYRLQVFSSGDASLLPRIRIKQIHVEFGGLPFQLERKVKLVQKRCCIPFFTATNNTCFIRVVPPTLSRSVQLRCIVLKDDGMPIYGTENFQPPLPAGIILKNCHILGPAKYALVVEVNGIKTEPESFLVTLAIGSAKKLITDENFG